MAVRKTRRTTTTRGRTGAASKRRRTTAASRKSASTGAVFNTLVPVVFIVGILFSLGFLLIMGYRTVTASSFFDARTVSVRGNSRVSRDDVERIVRSRTEKSGVWNASLDDIKGEVEKLTFVKAAVVSRVLPDGIDVKVDERVPRAVVRLSIGDVWVDDDGVYLPIAKNDVRPSYVMKGWDEARNDKSAKDNQDRLKTLLKMQTEWQNLGIDKRVESVDLTNVQDVQVSVQDSGQTVAVVLGKEDFGKRLQRSLDVIEGKGNSIAVLTTRGVNVVATYRNN